MVSRYPISNDALDQIGYDAVAVWIIRMKRPIISEPCLKIGHGEQTAFHSENAKREYERRKVERRLYRRLSRYYSPPEKVWDRPALLVEGKHDNHSMR